MRNYRQELKVQVLDLGPQITHPTEQRISTLNLVKNYLIGYTNEKRGSFIYSHLAWPPRNVPHVDDFKKCIIHALFLRETIK